jgi:hypothetical protein
MAELGSDQCWIYFHKTGRKYSLEIHSDGGPWANDIEAKIPISGKSIDKLKRLFRIKDDSTASGGTKP